MNIYNDDIMINEYLEQLWLPLFKGYSRMNIKSEFNWNDFN